MIGSRQELPEPEIGPERFEHFLASLLQAHPLPPEGDAIISRLLDPTTPLPPWRNIVQFLRQLNVSDDQLNRLGVSYGRSARDRRPVKPGGTSSQIPANGASDGTAKESPESRGQIRRPWIVLEDVDGHNQKPNPLDLETRPCAFEELDDQLLLYWAWAGRPSSRSLAQGSGGVFSHATVNKLTGSRRRDTDKPFSVKQDYVRAFIAACGGGEEEQKTWVSAWRWVDRNRTYPGQ